jgi:uncharacterized protein YutE (UPF0331/DUF86 family)
VCLKVRAMCLRCWQGGWIEAALAARLKRMVGFHNIVTHDDQSLQLPIVIAILKAHLDEFLQYSQVLLRGDGRVG